MFEISNNQFKNCPADPMIINSSQIVDVTHWNTDIIKVLAIGGGSGAVIILNYFTITNASAAVSASTVDVFVISY